MQIFQFEFCGKQHQLHIPSGGMYRQCAAEIITGECYPFPMHENPKVVVDIGAHVGEWTYCVATFWPGASIHAFEPYTPSYELMERNCGRLQNVVMYQSAVAAKGGKAQLHLSSMSAMCHSLMVRDTASGGTVEVDVVPAEYIAKLAPDILKVDCEGMEFEILEALPVRDIHRIYFEFHYENDRRRICEFLDKTHSLWRAQINSPCRGEMMYVRKD